MKKRHQSRQNRKRNDIISSLSLVENLCKSFLDSNNLINSPWFNLNGRLDKEVQQGFTLND